ncbi:hypothetical protein [Synechococcus sp. F70.1]|jgi:Uma2 family endonuclease|uniref:hypothetical protein n=1 Tax=Synechococcus sp. F70.1 TaxID=2964532 RepID=UPI0039C5CD47
MTVTPYRWPTQHDLPDTDDTPLDNEDQGRQYPLLREPLLLHWSDRQDFFVACNMGLYYALPRQVVVPDLFASARGSSLAGWHCPRKLCGVG